MDGAGHPYSPPVTTSVLRRHPLVQRPRIGLHEIRLDIPTSCVAIGFLYQLTSQQRELRSPGSTLPTAALFSPLLIKLKQQKIQFLRAASIPSISGQRIKLRSPYSLIYPAEKRSPSYRNSSPRTFRSSSSPPVPPRRPHPPARWKTCLNRSNSSFNSRTRSRQWTTPPRSRATYPLCG
jgi:hypothetical protein